jgi:hypothetical protein
MIATFVVAWEIYFVIDVKIQHKKMLDNSVSVKQDGSVLAVFTNDNFCRLI